MDGMTTLQVVVSWVAVGLVGVGGLALAYYTWRLHTLGDDWWYTIPRR